ncbi:HlyD family type I secretion periplasmic adaptor subunit [Shimia thalassica]|uniref:HlyD family type I secretion periplasmic adaptor subunit n=1 Tax=Shimia thalassica TaxID=1715693 RepID=UPI00273284B4|nr:HlyD family type I secretion periplasmic adaptor subunit [Shimia thalassica]MDP2493547.1 HlyD family type I secretion periplasmic adaptor subunit [Shimia thalassica]
MSDAHDVKADWPVRKYMLIGMFGLFVLLGGFGVWSVMTEISGAIIAGGRIEVDRNRQVVQHLDGGVVEEILVDEGDTVKKGQTLITLDPTMLASNLLITESQLFELMARRGRLEAERDGETELVFDEELLRIAAKNPEILDIVEGQRRLFHARNESLEREVEQLGKRRSQIVNQIDGIEAQQASLGVQLELIVEELKDQNTLLEKGLAQSSRVLALQREEAELSGSVGELTATKAQTEGRVTEIDIEVLKLNTRRREEAISRLRDLQYRELELAEQRRALIEQLARLEIKAPVSGIVYGLQVFTPKSVLRPADPVLFIVPQDRPLVIAAQVEPIHIEQIYIGQEVIVRFSSLDQRNTPELYGTVTSVSPDSFEDQATGAAYYRAEIQLPEGELAKLPENVTLIPGMPAESFLRTDDRTPIAYLLKPLADYFTKAFRES